MTGVWVAEQVKIAAIGIKIVKWVTMHGIALNIRANMEYFKNISPCGLAFGRPGNLDEFLPVKNSISLSQGNQTIIVYYGAKTTC
jgi:lipoyl(octanoyl) transferase